MQYAAVVAYYCRFEAPTEHRHETIDASTLQESTRQAGWKRLAKAAATLNNATAQGYLDRSGGGKFQISTVGENLVAMTLPGSGERGAAVRKKRTAKKQSKKKASNKKKSTRKK